jgi:hypothetical protein
MLAEGFQTAFRPAGGTALSWRRTTVPQAVTGSWAAVCLWVCVLALVVLLSWAAPEGGPDATPARAASAATWAFAASTWTLAVASVALSLAVFLLPRRGHAQVEADLLRLAERGGLPGTSLERSGTAYRYLADISGPGCRRPHHQGQPAGRTPASGHDQATPTAHPRGPGDSFGRRH